MADLMADVFSDNAFECLSLTAAINEMEHVPGRSGELVFVGVGEGISTTDIAIESKAESLELIQTTLRGAPPPQNSPDKRKLVHLGVPHIQIEDTIQADEVQNVREFGESGLTSAERVVADRMQKMNRRTDLTLEHHRLGALTGKILDADGSVLCDLFAEFDTLNGHGLAAPQDFAFSLDDYTTIGEANSVRTQCQAVQRFMRRKAKLVVPRSAKVWAFCGDNFFDRLIEHPSVKGVYDGWAAAQAALGDSYAFGVFEFGGVFFENYQGTDDNSTVAIAPDECRFFFTGVPGLYAEYYAPADFMETANTLGLPRYAKLANGHMNRWVNLLVQTNPLPLCLRPQTLCRGVIGDVPSV